MQSNRTSFASITYLASATGLCSAPSTNQHDPQYTRLFPFPSGRRRSPSIKASHTFATPKLRISHLSQYHHHIYPRRQNTPVCTTNPVSSMEKWPAVPKRVTVQHGASLDSRSDERLFPARETAEAPAILPPDLDPFPRMLPYPVEARYRSMKKTEWHDSLAQEGK